MYKLSIYHHFLRALFKERPHAIVGTGRSKNMWGECQAGIDAVVLRQNFLFGKSQVLLQRPFN